MKQGDGSFVIFPCRMDRGQVIFPKGLAN